MTVNYFQTQKEFGEHLTHVLSPSQPVDTPELLRGRGGQLVRIARALFADGRHVFIYGDRGVGKSSLAKTAAAQYRDGKKDYLFVSCERGSTLFSVVRSLAKMLIDSPVGEEQERRHRFTIGLKHFGYAYERINTTAAEEIPVPTSLDECVELIEAIVGAYGTQAIAVIDEFDTIASIEERQRFADLLKRMGDRNVALKFIFSGIASSLSDLLGGHMSSIRQLETVQLEPLNWTARGEIISAAAAEFGVQVSDSVVIRVSAISNGFPYYVHLLTEKLLWQIFDEREPCEEARPEHFRAALDAAVSSVFPHLKKPYELATQRVSEDYRDVVWAAADAYDLQRHSSWVFDSYKWICRELSKEPLTRQKFSQRLNDLKKPRFGTLLRNFGDKPGWYEYSENMVRGFVRLIAEHNGIQLRDQEYDGEPRRLTARAPASRPVQAYRRDFTPPIKFRGEKSDDEDEE